MGINEDEVCGIRRKLAIETGKAKDLTEDMNHTIITMCVMKETFEEKVYILEKKNIKLEEELRENEKQIKSVQSKEVEIERLKHRVSELQILNKKLKGENLRSTKENEGLKSGMLT